MWTVFLLASFLAAPLADAGDCLTTNAELYRDVLLRYNFSKTSGEQRDEPDSLSSWGLRCWQPDKRMDPKLKKALKQVISNSRIHPSYVASSLVDYQIAFGSSKQLLEEAKRNQGESRFFLIERILRQMGEAGNSKTVRPATTNTSSFPPDTDFINGPATFYSSPKGKASGSFPDNTRVSLMRQEGEWLLVASGRTKGWVNQNSLMGHTFNGIDPDGSSSLSRAAYMGYWETVRFLLRQGAKVNLTDGPGRNAVHWAALGAAYDLDGMESEILREVCSTSDADLDRADNQGDTPLHLAVGTRRPQVVQMLLTKGARALDVADKDGDTPVILAIRSGSPEIARLLIEGQADVNARDAKGLPLISLAIVHLNSDVVSALLSAPKIDIDALDPKGRSPLYLAVATGQTDLARRLVARGAKTDTVTADGKTLFHALYEPLGQNSPGNLQDLIALVVQTKADINRADAEGQTALSLAVTRKMLAVVKQLLSQKELKVNTSSCSGNHCLNYALGMWDDTGSEIALMFLNRPDIDVNQPDSSGNTPVHMAWNVFPTKYAGETAKAILSRNPNLEALNSEGDTPLLYNIAQRKTDNAKLLVGAKGINLDNPGKGEKPPLKLAEQYNLPEIVNLLRKAGAHN